MLLRKVYDEFVKTEAGRSWREDTLAMRGCLVKTDPRPFEAIDTAIEQNLVTTKKQQYVRRSIV